MVRLAPLEATDYGQIVEWIDSPALLTQWGGSPFSYPLTEAQLRDHYTSEETRRGFKAVADDEMVGIVELDRISHDHDSAAILRVFVVPEERNRGIGTSMLREALAIGFEDLGLHRIHLAVFEWNDPAIACYETVGFVREGVRRDSHRHDDEYWTTMQMSILEHEWRQSNAKA